MKNVYLLIGFLCFGSFVTAQTNKYANAYLDIGVSARALGMSNAYTAMSDDATSGYWNPAGLVRQKNAVELSLMHNEHFGGIVKYDFGAIAARINEKSSIGFSVIRQGVDNIPNTLELIDKDGNINYDRITSFSVADYAFMVSYARKTPVEGLSYGGNVKVLHRNIGKFGSGWGFGFDFGLQYIRKNLYVGAMFRDISSTVTTFTYNTETFAETFAITGNRILSKSTEIALPRINLGIAYKIQFSKKQTFFMTPSIDLVLTTDGKRNVVLPGKPISVDPRFGIEFGYKDIVFLRGGVWNIQKIKESETKSSWIVTPNIGVGFRIKTVFVDYALANVGNQSNGLFSHVFSLKIGFNRKGSGVLGKTKTIPNRPVIKNK